MSQHKTIETPSVSSEPSQISCSSSYLSDDCTLKNVALIKQSVHKTKPGKTLIVLEDIQYINQHQTSPYKAELYLYPFNLYSCEKTSLLILDLLVHMCHISLEINNCLMVKRHRCSEYLRGQNSSILCAIDGNRCNRNA